MSGKLPIIAIVGRTNVGKSTLFNLLVGGRRSIVEDTPGVTRDRNYAFINRFEFPFRLIDTGGLVGEEGSGYSDAVRAQAELAIQEADVVITLFDGLHGVHPLDSEVVDTLRRSGKPVIWVVNKCEKPASELVATELYALGIEDVLCISAAHNKNTQELIGRVKKICEKEGAMPRDANPDEGIKVALLGKPNVGKSTFLNTLLGEERLITSNEAGTTRDNIDIPIKRDGQQYLFVDTAGLRKKAKVKDHSVERFSTLRTMRSLARCNVAVLMLDATSGPPNEQDSKIAGQIHERGKGLVIVVNKWDAVEKDHKSAKEYEDSVRHEFKFARYAPVIFTSALTGKRCPSVFSKVKEVYESCNLRIQTAELNRILNTAFVRRPPPVHRGEPVKLFFATQIEVAPPTMVLFTNNTGKVNFSYQRYLKNSLRKAYPFTGTDIKLVIRKRTEHAERMKAAEL